MNKIISISFTCVACALLLALGWAGGSRWPFAALRGEETPEIQRDTIIRRDTTYLTKDSLIYVTHYKNTTDTVTLYDIHHDTVTVPIPIEHKHEHYSDADVWYHGFRAGIDSLAVYPLTMTVTEIRREKASRWGISAYAGYGLTISKQPQLAPSVGVAITYDLIQF